MQANHGFGPRPMRRARKGDWLLLVFAIALWGFASGSPLMRPKQSIATDSRFDRPVVTPIDRIADAEAEVKLDGRTDATASHN